MLRTEYIESVYDIMCLKVCCDSFEMLEASELSTLVVTWAENELCKGTDSETVQIIASLGLDILPDFYEVEKYLLILQGELGIQKPSAAESALVWLRITLSQLLEVSSESEHEQAIIDVFHDYNLYSRFNAYTNDYSTSYIFGYTVDSMYEIYWDLYGDNYTRSYTKASVMTWHQVNDYLKERLMPIYRKLKTPDWIRILK